MADDPEDDIFAVHIFTPGPITKMLHRSAVALCFAIL